jgi:hypothetical protein
MGAHSAVGPGPTRAVTTAAGLAAALATTAATGLLTGGTALATDGSGTAGHAHGHGWGSSDERDTDGGRTAPNVASATQAWCDVFGDDDRGDDGFSCDPGDGSSDDSGPAGDAATAAAPTTPPAPHARSSVPDHPTVQPIVAPPASASAGKRVVPIAATG